METSLANIGTQWYFNPPAAPHFSGLWEADVKRSKSHLKKTVGNATFSYKELATVLTQIFSRSVTSTSAWTKFIFNSLKFFELIIQIRIANQAANLAIRFLLSIRSMTT